MTETQSATYPDPVTEFDQLPADREARIPWTTWLPYLLLSLVVTAIYYKVVGSLVMNWYTNPDFSHGFLVAPFAAFLLWDKRKVLRNTPILQTWSGIWLVVAAIFVLFLGVYGAELFLSRLSLVMLLGGVVWTIFGRTFLREVRFAILVLLLAIPIPAVIFNQVTFPLQLFASRMASAILPLFGVPVLRDGNIIQLPALQLEVAEACSGIRSLMSLFAVAIFYGYFLEHSTWRRVVLALAALPIAVFANAARIVGTGLCVQYWNPDKAVGFFHEFSGWLMFLVSLSCLYVVHKLIHLKIPASRTSQ
ncbi:MAG: exosortase/archaeosortase family protein [Acidobacteriaceae bacterium]